MMSLAQALAQVGSGPGWESLRESFRTGGDAQTLGGFVLVLAGLVVVAVAVVYILTRRRLPKQASLNAMKEVARVLQLGSQARRDIELVAGRAGVRQPAAILLSPANLSAAVRRGCNGLDDPSLTARMNELSVKLFGSALPPAARNEKGVGVGG
ncbi:hypothetical protein RAS1_25950 [Phycisphaerae bacterium RAS1]|nr:hypothetical protein RAS1_25950 [Phycisphaerae bacterium RAS1]